MLTEFQEKIEADFTFLVRGKLLVACSGGVDSVVLAHLCHRIGLDISLAHCNFNLRGAESDGDENFVKELGKNLGIDTFSKVFDTLGYLNQHGGSIQMAARTLRYQWFHGLLEKKGFDYLLTAHHADDNLETFLINLSRGTGIEGLMGIPAQNGRIIRPLLRFPRKVIEDYAKGEGLEWREDSSNRDNKYLRNKIRLELVPVLKELHPNFLDNFLTTQTYLEQTRVLADHHLKELKNRLFQPKGDTFIITIGELHKMVPLEAYLYGLFHEYGFTEWDNVKGLLDAMSGKEVLSKTHRLLKDRTHLILSPLQSEEDGVYFIHDGESFVQDPIHLRMEIVPSLGQATSNTIYLDKEKLNFPLVLRKWQNGDYFYPFGMKGKKKLSKFFKDDKVDVISKEKQWLLCSDDEIVWVVGRRADERFKIDAATREILKITWIL
ncbi:tRNA lysidine(34) synthetase TilS [Flagellimonas meishanensis]|uniref:tRNA lysidine(34) synthetase TilS n=1 Tax=Flagellimonas meishanensis TaxID=2873264 RepID=UPI001CA5F53B|nr:tRNA lysidine(34) synthetase TilS [[Muricauda] meishanensis]